MKSNQKLLDTLWEYIDTFNPYTSEEEKKILSVVAKKSEEFVKSMTNEQTVAFEDYRDSLWELHSVERKEAFAKGVKFASQFLLEATENRDVEAPSPTKLK